MKKDSREPTSLTCACFGYARARYLAGVASEFTAHGPERMRSENRRSPRGRRVVGEGYRKFINFSPAKFRTSGADYLEYL